MKNLVQLLREKDKYEKMKENARTTSEKLKKEKTKNI